MRAASSAIRSTASAHFCRSSSRYSGIVLVVMAKCGRNISVQAVQYWPFGDNSRGASRRCTLEVVPNRPSYLRVSSTPVASVSEDKPGAIGKFSPSPATAEAQPLRWQCRRSSAGAPPSVVGGKEEIDQQPRGKKSSHTPLSVVGGTHDLSGQSSSVVRPFCGYGERMWLISPL